MAKEDNLKRGNPETEFRGRLAVEAQKKSAASRKRNNSIRKLGLQMLSSQMDVDAETIRNIKRMGFDTDKPEMQMIILARIGAAALSKDPKLALQATDMLLDITGNDVRTQIAAESRKLERERIKLERERLELEKAKLTGGTAEDENAGAEFIAALTAVGSEVWVDGGDEPKGADTHVDAEPT